MTMYTPQPYCSDVEIGADDMLLFCTDGLTETVAARAIAARLLTFAEPRARVSYDLSPSYGWLRPRHIVTVSDEEIGANGIGIVDKLSISELGINVEIIILVPER